MCLFVELLLMYSVLLIYILESASLKIVLKFMHEVMILIKYAFLAVMETAECYNELQCVLLSFALYSIL